MKYKARNLDLLWPWPHSFTVPPAWNPGAPYDVAYHAGQAQMLKNFLGDEDAMDELRLSIQRATGELREMILGEVEVIHAYPSGVQIIGHQLCGINASTPMACFFCQYGHMMECHFPRTCPQAKCAHLQATDWSSSAEAS